MKLTEKPIASDELLDGSKIVLLLSLFLSIVKSWQEDITTLVKIWQIYNENNRGKTIALGLKLKINRLYGLKNIWKCYLKIRFSIFLNLMITNLAFIFKC